MNSMTKENAVICSKSARYDKDLHSLCPDDGWPGMLRYQLKPGIIRRKKRKKSHVSNGCWATLSHLVGQMLFLIGLYELLLILAGRARGYWRGCGSGSQWAGGEALWEGWRTGSCSAAGENARSFNQPKEPPLCPEPRLDTLSPVFDIQWMYIYSSPSGISVVLVHSQILCWRSWYCLFSSSVCLSSVFFPHMTNVAVVVEISAQSWIHLQWQY